MRIERFAFKPANQKLLYEKPYYKSGRSLKLQSINQSKTIMTANVQRLAPPGGTKVLWAWAFMVLVSFVQGAPISCIAGKQDNGASVCVNCVVGTYKTTSYGLCLPCPQGYSCSLNSGLYDVEPVPCSMATNNHYSNHGDSSCHGCPAGFACPNVYDLPIPCDDGWISALNEVECTPCGQGSICANKASTATAVTTNEFSRPGQDRVTRILPGQLLVDSTVGAVTCVPGYFSDGALNICTICEEQNYCPNAQGDEYPCPAGFYAGLGQESCTGCPEGFSCNIGDDTYGDYPVPCASGSYALGFAFECTPCPMGYYCPDPAGVPVICPKGSYTDSTGQAECVVCDDDGQQCTDLQTAPQSCTWSTDPTTDGWRVYSPFETNPICKQVPVGYVYSGAFSDYPTPLDLLSLEWADDIDLDTALTQTGSNAVAFTTTPEFACPSGYLVNPSDGVGCQLQTVGTAACASGQFAYPDPTGTCLDCPIGFYCPTTAGPPIICPWGYYADTTLNTACTRCPPKHKCPDVFSAPIECEDDGTYFAYSAGGTTECYPLPPDMTRNDNVLIGDYTDDTYEFCHQGIIGLTAEEGCATCPDGKECKQFNEDPVDCDLTRFDSLAGEIFCSPKQVGYVGDNADETVDIWEVGQTGSYSWQGNTDGNDFDCPAGYQCIWSWRQSWQRCPPGTQSNAGDGYCAPCPAGVTCPSMRDSSENVDVPSHFWSPLGTSIEFPVPAGFYGIDKTDAQWDANSAPFEGGNMVIRPCPAGWFSGSETYGNEFAQQGINPCLPCPANLFCPYQDQEPVIKCSSGYGVIDDGSTGNIFCLPCGQNQVQSDDNNCVDFWDLSPVDQTVSINSMLGYGLIHPFYLPEKCPYGTYSDATTIADNTKFDCVPYDSGFYKASGGSDSVKDDTPIPIGYFGDAWNERTSAYNMYACPAGYRPVATTADDENFDYEDADACELCPAGSYCIGGDSPEQACPAGYFCPAGTQHPTQFPCFYGSTGSAINSEWMDDCQYVEVGFTDEQFCSVGIAFNANDCHENPTWVESYSYIEYLVGGTPTNWNLPYFVTFDSCGPGNYYNGATCVTCTAGYFCPGSSLPLPCPPGKTSGTGQSVCDLYSTAGSVLTGWGTVSTYAQETGFLVADGQSNLWEFPCYYGTEQTAVSTSCVACTAGYSCMLGASDGNFGLSTKLDCDFGYECPLGTLHPFQYPCRGGYADSKGLAACKLCEAGFWCPRGSVTSAYRYCPPGFDCSAGQIEDYRDSPCPKGETKMRRNDDFLPAQGWDDQVCETCDEGYFCNQHYPFNMDVNNIVANTNYMEPKKCPPGTFQQEQSPGVGAESVLDCQECPINFQCPVAGLSIPVMCAIGEFSPAKSHRCYPCDAKMDCSEDAWIVDYGDNQFDMKQDIEDHLWLYADFTITGATYNKDTCPSGYHCYFSANGDYQFEECPIGHYCPTNPQGYTAVIPCRAGTWNENTQQTSSTSCLFTAAGSWSPGQSLIPGQLYVKATEQCWPGYYCPLSSGVSDNSNPQQIACLPGKYNKNWGQTSCDTTCPAGSYCPYATINPISCPPGYYCPAGVSYPTPCGVGTIGKFSGKSSSGDCVACPKGHFCIEIGATAPTGLCDPGYYCDEGSTDPRENLCICGGYCQAGSYWSADDDTNIHRCRAGTFGDDTFGLAQATECFVCPPGFACDGWEFYCTEDDLESCVPGFYCPSGAKSIEWIQTDPGFYTGWEYSEQVPCPIGYYTNEYAAEYWKDDEDKVNPPCEPCPDSYFCPNEGMSDPTGFPCPAGSYCAEDWYDGTAQPTLCPEGTFNPIMYAYEEYNYCLDCTFGQYCAGEGNVVETGPCAAGHFCIEKATSARPNNYQNEWQLLDYGICPTGRYCPEGTAFPLMCPQGTYSNKLGLESADQCTICDPGYFCEGNGLTQPSGECDAGFYCEEGEVQPRPDGKECDEGTYCESGSFEMTFCPPGTYQNNIQNDFCYTCPQGMYCTDDSNTWTEGATHPEPCVIGHYCPEGTTELFGIPCAVGYFQPLTGMKECLICKAGFYCGQTEMTALDATNVCSEGYYCKNGAYVYKPFNLELTKGDICPQGYYCPAGRGFPTPCPAGKACPLFGTGENAPQQCKAGYFCRNGATSITPLDLSLEGGEPCWPGHYCPSVTSSPIPCGPGTYSSSKGNKAAADCLTCPLGNFCEGYGTEEPKPCDEGYYCATGEKSRRPAGKFCLPGNYCSNGISNACTAGFYQDQQAQYECKPCPAGFECTSFTTLTDCGIYHYCPFGKDTKIACDANFYTHQLNADADHDCLPCPKGYQCLIADLVETLCPEGFWCDEGKAAVICPAGFYCPEGATEPYPCLPGFTCIEGSISSTEPCPAGSYCPGGSKDPGSDNSIPYTIFDCPVGHFCVAGTGYPTPCSLGYYNGLTKQVACTLCEDFVTSYTDDDTTRNCDARGLSAPVSTTFYVPPGWYWDGTNIVACPIGNWCNYPSNAVTDGFNVCPDGFYAPNKYNYNCFPCPEGYYCEDHKYPKLCPAGSYCGPETWGTAGVIQGTNTEADLCPAQTYLPYQGSKYQEQCFECQEGFQCETTGLLTPGTECPAGTFCPWGHQDHDINKLLSLCADGTYCPWDHILNDQYTLIGGLDFNYLDGTSDANVARRNRGAPITCFVGSYCPEGSAYPMNCPAGSFNDATGQTDISSCIQAAMYDACPLRGSTSEECRLQEDEFEDFYCAPGFICSTDSTGAGGSVGSIGFWPDPAQHGALCGIGEYCVPSFKGPQDCPTGHYNPNTAQWECLYCPAGFLCDVEGISSIDTGFDCTPGKYCPAQTDLVLNEEIDCPPGTYGPTANAKSADDCLICQQGWYCVGGEATKTGECAAGKFCPIGMSDINGGAGIYEFGLPEGGDCPVGHYCPQGTQAPVPCEPGTYMTSTGATVCDPCPEGKYCDEHGMGDSDLDDPFSVYQRCDPGFVCLGGAIVPYPDDGVTGMLCEPGSYCPMGTVEQLECPEGTFETRDGSWECQTCPVGSFCPAGSVQASQCDGGYCPQGVSEPIPCPDGRFAELGVNKGLMDAGDCPYCPSGKYCLGGVIAGECSSGYFCDFGAKEAEDDTKLCPVGHFCKHGTLLPTRCNHGYYIAVEGATDESFCMACQAGFYCLENDSVMRVCPVGHFCPDKAKEPTPCWTGTFNSKTGKTNSADCLQCNLGHLCNETGIADPSDYLCPAGHYCPYKGMKKDATPCPGGTYRRENGASKVSECYACPGGFFCQQGCDEPEPCHIGFSCPPGSERAHSCEPGNYCNALNVYQQLCKEGFACPNYATDIYNLCDHGTFCPSGTIYPQKCPPGTRSVLGSEKVLEKLSCVTCSKGTYSEPGAQICQSCKAGYVCNAGSISPTPNNPSQGGVPASPGHYATVGATEESACPIGTYSTKVAATSINDCFSCPQGQFNDLIGQTQCQFCPSGAISKPGATTCQCTGDNRVFLTGGLGTEKTCACLPSYQPILGTDLYSTDTDCEKIVYDICDPQTQQRDSYGQCRDKNDCATECNGGPGQLNSLGVCECVNFVDPNSLCNSECLAAQPILKFDNGQLVYTDSTGKVIQTVSLNNTLGVTTCQSSATGSCDVKVISMGANNFEAALPIVSSFSSTKTTGLKAMRNNSFKGNRAIVSEEVFESQSPAAVVVVQPEPKTYWPWEILSSGRKLQTTSSFMTDPIICAKEGTAILFQNLANGTYPVYQRDNLLNTNDEFDYGEFNKLAQTLADPNNTKKQFLYQFQTPGIYVFSDSRDVKHITVFAILGPEEHCPNGNSFLPMTEKSLLTVGAFQRDVLTPPDWKFFFIVLIGFCVIIVLSVILISYIYKRNWQQHHVAPIHYQQAQYKSVKSSDPHDKNALVSVNTEASAFEFRHKGADNPLEDKLERRMLGVDPAKERQKTKQRARKDLTIREVEELKSGLARHLKQIRKITKRVKAKQHLSSDDDHGLTSDENEVIEVRKNIARMQRLLRQNGSILRGEDGAPDIAINENEVVASKLWDLREGDVARERRRKQMEEQDVVRKEQEQIDLKLNEQRIQVKLAEEAEAKRRSLEAEQNKILQTQHEVALDRGKLFKDRLEKEGVDQNDTSNLLGELEKKMQTVEDILESDQSRQNDVLQMKLNQRKNRRKFLQDSLVDMDKKVSSKEKEAVVETDKVTLEFQQQYDAEMAVLEKNFQVEKNQMLERHKLQKQEKLGDFQDRLQNSGGGNALQKVLMEYQKAQVQVDRDLDKHRAKEEDALNREFAARKAKLRAQIDLQRNSAQGEIDAKYGKDSLDNGKKMIEETLRQKEQSLLSSGDMVAEHADRIKEATQMAKLNQEAEKRRIAREQLYYQHERERRFVEGIDQKEGLAADYDIQNEIKKLREGSNAPYDSKLDLIKEKEELLKRIDNTLEEDVKAFLLNQVKEVDAALEAALRSQNTAQDTALAFKLAARKRKRQRAIGMDRAIRSRHTQERINFQLNRSDDFAVKSKELTRRAIEDIIKDMHMEKPTEEIPGAVDRLLDEKNQKELNELLLSLYEQKTIELREEVLAILEEKVLRIQLAKKQLLDRKAGIEAIINGSKADKEEKARLSAEKNGIDAKLKSEIAALEAEYAILEKKVLFDLHQRCVDRESKAFLQLQKDQTEERNAIFEKFFSKDLITTINQVANMREHQEMEGYRNELQQEMTQKLSKLREHSSSLDSLLADDKKAIDKLKAVDEKLREKEAAELKREREAFKKEKHMGNSEEIVKKLREEHERNMRELGEKFNDERQRQMDIINDEMKKRKLDQVEYRKQLEMEAIQAAEKAERDRIEDEARIKKMLERKKQLASTLDSKQRLLFKHMYSRHLYPFNEVMHREQMKREDLAFHLEREESEFKTNVKQTLIDRVTALELQLQSDIGLRNKDQRTFDDDARSQRSFHEGTSVSSATRARLGSKVGTSLLKKIKKNSNGDTGFKF